MKENAIFGPDDARAVQDLARHQMIAKLYADVLQDAVICMIEDWDPYEYLEMLEDAIQGVREEIERKVVKQ